MTPLQRNLLILILGVIFWYFSGTFFDLAFGWEIPFFGFVGIEPFEFLREFGVLIGVAFAVFLYVMLERRKIE